jgi:hypothetical protein
MTVKGMSRDLSDEDVRAAVIGEIQRRFPTVSEPQIARDAERELRSFGEPPVRQYLPVLVSRRLQARYRTS